jgi:hypothetical protein
MVKQIAILCLCIGTFIGCKYPAYFFYDYNRIDKYPAYFSYDYNRIDKYLSLTVLSYPDTICAGDTIELSIKFENKTDSSFFFHPDGVLSIEYYFPSYDFVFWDDLKPCYYLNKQLSVEHPCWIEGRGSYIKKYEIKTDDVPFSSGTNKLRIEYYFFNRGNHPILKEGKRIIYGILVSDPFTMCIL